MISQQNSTPPAVPRTIYIPPKPETLHPVAPAVATPTPIPLAAAGRSELRRRRCAGRPDEPQGGDADVLPGDRRR